MIKIALTDLNNNRISFNHLEETTDGISASFSLERLTDVSENPHIDYFNISHKELDLLGGFIAYLLKANINDLYLHSYMQKLKITKDRELNNNLTRENNVRLKDAGVTFLLYDVFEDNNIINISLAVILNTNGVENFIYSFLSFKELTEFFELVSFAHNKVQNEEDFIKFTKEVEKNQAELLEKTGDSVHTNFDELDQLIEDGIIDNSF